MKSPLRIAVLAAALLLSAPLTAPPAPRAEAASVNDLQKQKEALEKQAKAKEAEAQRQSGLADKAAAKAEEVAGSITDLQGTIQGTVQEIGSTQAGIEQKNQEGATLESQLRTVKDQQDALLRQMYMMRTSMPDGIVLFGDQPISTREKQQAQFNALKRTVAAAYVKTQEARIAVEGVRTQLTKKSDDLTHLRDQQDEQKKGLAAYQQTQTNLAVNAQAEMDRLDREADAARRKAGQIEAQIAVALTAAIKRAGSGNLSGNGPGTGIRIGQGDFVGIQGSTGFSTGDHVHYEVRVNNVAVNPRPYISSNRLGWPLDGFRVTQEFGYTQYALQGAYGGGPHTGIDIAGAKGSPVSAPQSGSIILNQFYGGYGHAVAILGDDGLVTLMGHMR